MLDKSNFNKDMLPALEQLKGADIAPLRERLGVSQPVLAMILNVSISAVRSWEARPDFNIRGGDLIVLNQLSKKGIHGYLFNPDSEPSNRQVSEAANDLLMTAKATSEGVLVDADTLESLRAAMGFREGLQDADSVARSLQSKAVGQFAAQVLDILAESITIVDAEKAVIEIVNRHIEK